MNGLDAKDDGAIVDAFDTACASYPRGWEAAEPVDVVDAAEPAAATPPAPPQQRGAPPLAAAAAASAPPPRGLALPPPDGYAAAAPPVGLAMPPPDGYIAPEPAAPPAAAPPASLSSTAPPLPPAGLPAFPPTTGDSGDLADLLNSWYYAGYYTGLQEARTENAKRTGQQPS